MAKGDIRVKDGHRWNARPYFTKAGQTAIKAGELVIQDASGDEEYVQLPADGDTNAKIWVGLAVSNDTNAASADGVVYVVDALDAEFIGKAKTWANISKAMLNTKVVIDVTSTVQTLDELVTTNGALLILNFDVNKQEVYFRIDASNRLQS